MQELKEFYLLRCLNSVPGMEVPSAVAIIMLMAVTVWVRRLWCPFLYCDGEPTHP